MPVAGKKKKDKKTKPKTKVVKQRQKQSTKVIVNIDNSKKSANRGGSKTQPPREVIHTTSQIQPFPISQPYQNPFTPPIEYQTPFTQNRPIETPNTIGEPPSLGYLQQKTPDKRHINIIPEQPKDIRDLWTSNSDDQSSLYTPEGNFADFYSNTFDKTPEANPINTINTINTPIFISPKDTKPYKDGMEQLDNMIYRIDESVKKTKKRIAKNK